MNVVNSLCNYMTITKDRNTTLLTTDFLYTSPVLPNVLTERSLVWITHSS